MTARGTIESFTEKARSIHGDKYDYSKAMYAGAHAKLEIICPEHGAFMQQATTHLSHSGCPKCGDRVTSGAKIKYTTEEFAAQAREVHGDRYNYSQSVYVRNKAKLEIICPEHGVFLQTPEVHLAGSGCSICAYTSRQEKRRGTLQEFVSRATKIHASKYDYSQAVYTGTHKKLKITCPKHGVFSQTASSHLNGSGCSKCGRKSAGDSKKLCREDFLSRAAEIHNNKYDYSAVDYETSKEKVTIICPVHGKFAQEVASHLQGFGCAKCSREQSTPEKELQAFVSEMYTGIVSCNDKTIILSPRGRPMELGIYLPEIGLGIEMNGIYFHSERFKIDKDYHAHKSRQCGIKGVQLIHVFEDDWVLRRKAVENMLRAKLKVADRTFARKCTAAIEPYSAVKEFMSEKHLQGAGRGENVTLRFENKIVAVCTFSKNLSNRGRVQEGVWELVRYASDGVVVGGVSKCLSFFVNASQPKSVISYSDNTVSQGGVYDRLGFKLEAELPPDYKYVDKSKVPSRRSHKANFTRSKLKNKLLNFNPAESEKQNCQRHGYYRIWDCGKKKWTLNLGG